MSENTVNVMIVDDHPIVRAGVVAVLSAQPNLSICCEASSEKEALELIKTCSPDVAIIDLSLTTSSGFSLFRRLLRDSPGLRILVLSMHDELIYAGKVLRAGAHGYVMKQEATETLLTAINTVLRGQRYVSDRMRDRLLAGIAEGTSPTGKAPSGLSSLTRTELVILQLIANGASSREIAEQLKRSIKTVDVHRANMRRKLQLPNNAALMHFAIQSMLQTESLTS